MNDAIKNRFHPDHYADLKKSGLTDETIADAGIASVPPDLINKKLGFNVQVTSMYEIPYGDGFSRYKGFYGENGNGKKPKYLQRKSSGNRLYIPSYVKPKLTDASVPLYITEGEKKALKAAQEGLSCIAVSGLWSWKVKDENALIPDFDEIAFDDRTVYLVPDNDWLEPNRQGKHKNLKQAVYELAYLLIDRGAIVSHVQLPVQGKTKVGLDDFLCSQSVTEFKTLPDHQIRKMTVEEEIDSLSHEGLDSYDLKRVIFRISQESSEAQRNYYVKRLSNKTGIGRRSIHKDIEKLAGQQKQEIVDSNIMIVHPSYDVQAHFMVLGFRETIVVNNVPKERNFYILSTGNSCHLIDETTYQMRDGRIVFDNRERLLIMINARWSKDRLQDFVKSIDAPEGLYREIKETLKKFIELQKDGQYGLVAAWIIATYFHRCFYAFVFLFFYGKKQTGKSRTLDLLERLAFNAMKIKGISVASLADSIDGVRSTVLIDQAESLSNPKNEEILGILADSYTIGGGKRRIVSLSNNSRRVLEFETFSPKAFASIKDIDPDLKDRCIQIPMVRTADNYPEAEPHLPIWRELRDKLYRLSLTKWSAVQQIYPDTGKDVSRRARELWRPLETILVMEGVSGIDKKEVFDVFQGAMNESQAELTDAEHEFFEVLMGELEGSEDEMATLTASEIAGNMKNNYGMNEKGLQTWVGRMINQFSLFDRHASRKDNKRAYVFSLGHVKNIYERYVDTGGIGGDVAETVEKQEFQVTHLHKKGGQVEATGGKDTTLPFEKTTSENEVVSSNPHQNNDNNHVTTETTEQEEDNEIVIEGDL